MVGGGSEEEPNLSIRGVVFVHISMSDFVRVLSDFVRVLSSDYSNSVAT